MFKNQYIVLLSVLLLSFAFCETIDNSEVKLPLSQYLRLLEREKTTPITVVEETLLKGDYKSSSFQIILKGRAVAPWKEVAVLENFEGHLRACSGNGILSMKDSQYTLLPLGNNFQVSCKITPKNKNLELGVLNTLYFESQVANAESNVTSDNNQTHKVALFEKVTAQENKKHADVIAKAQYKLTILPDNSKFEYTFQLNNPNRGLEKYELNWINAEFIESVETALKYEETNSGLIVTLPAGSHVVLVKGKLNNAQFKPLLASEEQYLLIQNHPLMQVQAATNWRRIATDESSMAQDYNSARAFLIDPKQSLTWSSKKLQAFSALGYTLKNANYLYYVARDGKAIVEATYRIMNQGTPEISLNIPGKALYMSIDGQSSPLYKDDKNALLVSMNSGEHTLVVQYQTESKERLLASIEKAELLKPQAVLSNSSVTVRLDPAWKMMVANFGDTLYTQINFNNLFLALIIFTCFFYLLKLYKIHEKRILYTVPTSFAALSIIDSFYVLVFIFLAVVMTTWKFRSLIANFFKKISSVRLSWKSAIIGTLVFVVLSGGFLVVMSIGSSFKHQRSQVYKQNLNQLSGDSYAQKAMEESDGETFGSMLTNSAPGAVGTLLGQKTRGAGAPSDSISTTQDNYEGLPAKIDIPYSGNNYTFTSSLVDAEKSLYLNSFYIKGYLYLIFDLVIVLALVAVLYNQRKYLKEILVNS